MAEDLLRQPIGLWLKRADEAITRYTNSVLAERGLTRFHWQALNLLSERGEMTLDGLFDEIGVFVSRSELEGIVSDFEGRGWAARNGDAVSLTEAGVQARHDVFQQMNAVREASTRGISPEDYATTVRTLQQLVQNLS